jgi:hypothetical protein
MNYAPPPELLSQPLVMLCEGRSDNEFFKRLISSRHIPDFCFPFPPADEDRSEETGSLHGRDGFVNMLRVLNLYFKLYPERREQVRGILIAVDAANNATESFKHVTKQIIAAGQFGEPKKPLDIGRNAPHPPISVLLVPGSTEADKGGLESLCIQAMSDFAKELECVEAFFECCPTDFAKWNAETFDKARLRCLIAATYEHDPTRSTSTAFAKYQKKHPPAIDIEKKCFDPLAENIRSFCVQV